MYIRNNIQVYKGKDDRKKGRDDLEKERGQRLVIWH